VENNKERMREKIIGATIENRKFVCQRYRRQSICM